MPANFVPSGDDLLRFAPETILTVAGTLLMIGLAVPLTLGLVGPNSWYGFRVRRTLGDPGAWYDANAFAGRCLFRSGIGAALACFVLYWTPAIDPVAYAAACPTVLLVESDQFAVRRHSGLAAGLGQ